MLGGIDKVLGQILEELKGMRKDLNEKTAEINKRLADIEEQNKKRFRKLHPDMKP